MISLLFGMDYFISLHLTSVNNKLINYKLDYSKAMTSSNKRTKFLFFIDTPYLKVKDVLKYQQSEIINKLLKENVFIYSNSLLRKNYFYEKSKLSYTPKRFDIIIKNHRAYFFLKEDN